MSNKLVSVVSAFSLYLFFSFKYYPKPYQVKLISLSFVIVLIGSYGVASIFDKIEFVSIIIKIICLLVVLMSTSFFLLEKKYLQKIKLKLK